MSIIRGLRYPTALAFGMLLTGILFWGLWSFTNVTFQIPTIKSVPIEYPGVREDTKPVEKFAPEVIAPPPLLPPIDTGRISDRTVEVFPPTLSVPVDAPDIDGPVIGYAQDQDAAPLVRINPEYPPRAEALGIEGWVKVQYTVTGTGAVTDVVVIENSPSNIFDEAAVKAVSRWRYNPKVEGAVAVERVGMQTILRFNLED